MYDMNNLVFLELFLFICKGSNSPCVCAAPEKPPFFTFLLCSVAERCELGHALLGDPKMRKTAALVLCRSVGNDFAIAMVKFSSIQLVSYFGSRGRPLTRESPYHINLVSLAFLITVNICHFLYLSHFLLPLNINASKIYHTFLL